MRAYHLVFIVLVSTLILSGCKKSDFDSEKVKIKYDGKKRYYLLHIPDNFESEQTRSLVIALHGGLGTPYNIEEQSQLSVTSDEKGFIVCYPQGLNRTWNAGDCCAPASKKGRDDVGFISALIDELLGSYDIDPERVYITGMSNGGFMSYSLACELSHKISAIAPVAGTMTAERCRPDNPVSIMHFHSYNDSGVPHDGGVGDGPSKNYKAPLDSVMQVWSDLNNCLTVDSLVHDGTDYDHRTWRNCDNGDELHLYITHDGGHQWPMGVKPTRNSDEPSQAVNANELMWEFFKSRW